MSTPHTRQATSAFPDLSPTSAAAVASSPSPSPNAQRKNSEIQTQTASNSPASLRSSPRGRLQLPQHHDADDDVADDEEEASLLAESCRSRSSAATSANLGATVASLDDGAPAVQSQDVSNSSSIVVGSYGATSPARTTTANGSAVGRNAQKPSSSPLSLLHRQMWINFGSRKSTSPNNNNSFGRQSCDVEADDVELLPVASSPQPHKLSSSPDACVAMSTSQQPRHARGGVGPTRQWTVAMRNATIELPRGTAAAGWCCSRTRTPSIRDLNFLLRPGSVCAVLDSCQLGERAVEAFISSWDQPPALSSLDPASPSASSLNAAPSRSQRLRPCHLVARVVAGLAADRVVSGQALANGVLPLGSSASKRHSAFVPKEPVAFRGASVRENLKFSLQMRLVQRPSTGYSSAVQLQRVVELLNLGPHLGTEVCRLPAGLAKATDIAMELLFDPHVLVLEDPFAGLTCYDFTFLMATLRSLAKERDCVVLMSLSSMPWAVYECTDELVLLGDEGSHLFTGTRDECAVFFAECLGLPETSYSCGESILDQLHQWSRLERAVGGVQDQRTPTAEILAAAAGSGSGSGTERDEEGERRPSGGGRSPATPRSVSGGSRASTGGAVVLTNGPGVMGEVSDAFRACPFSVRLASDIADALERQADGDAKDRSVVDVAGYRDEDYFDSLSHADNYAPQVVLSGVKFVRLLGFVLRHSLLRADVVGVWFILFFSFLVCVALSHRQHDDQNGMMNKRGIIFFMVSCVIYANTTFLPRELEDRELFVHGKAALYFSSFSYFLVLITRIMLPRFFYCVAIVALAKFIFAQAMPLAWLLGLTSVTHAALVVLLVYYCPAHRSWLIMPLLLSYYAYAVIFSGFLINLSFIPKFFVHVSILRPAYGGAVVSVLRGQPFSCDATPGQDIRSSYCYTGDQYLDLQGLQGDTVGGNATELLVEFLVLLLLIFLRMLWLD